MPSPSITRSPTIGWLPLGKATWVAALSLVAGSTALLDIIVAIYCPAHQLSHWLKYQLIRRFSVSQKRHDFGG